MIWCGGINRVETNYRFLRMLCQDSDDMGEIFERDYCLQLVLRINLMYT